MPEKLVHGLEALLAGGTAGHDDTSSALADAGWIVYVGSEIMAILMRRKKSSPPAISHR
jgi:hypothetical protein